MEGCSAEHLEKTMRELFECGMLSKREYKEFKRAFDDVVEEKK